MSAPARGDVWWAESPDVGRRPVLVMTRSAAIGVLHTVLVAPLTRTVRGIATELRLGPDDGLPQDCAASFDNFGPMPKAYLVERICMLSEPRMQAACTALRVATDC